MFVNILRYGSTKARSFKPVSHIIFDIDGLLLKTEELYYKADSTVLKRYGKEYPWELRMRVLGRTEQETAKFLVNELKLPISESKYQEEARAVALELLKDATLMPGAERLIKHLSANNVPIALATSSGAASVEAKTAKHKSLFKLFNHIVMASSDPEIKKGKPAPDVFLAAAKKFPDTPSGEKCLVFEDAPNGVRAGLSAGMQVVLVPEDYVDQKDRQTATLVINSLLEFQPELFGLPPFKK